jgi:Fe-S-cluster containining protein
MPIFFECDRCTACCRLPGQVRLNEPEITRAAEFLGLSEVDFIEKFTRLAGDRRGLALQDKPGGECIFLDGRDCAINAVKPQQCSAFPNLWNFPGFREICRAKEVAMEEADYQSAILRATGRKL